MHKFLFFFLAIFIVSSCTDTGKKEKYTTEPRPISAPQEQYLGAEKCKECHETAFSDWKKSDHFYSMQKATSEYVLGEFGTSYVADQITYNFFKTDSSFWVNIIENEVSKDFEIAYTFGWHPLQQYLIKTEKGKFQTLRASWDTEKNKWFHQSAGTIVEPHDWLSWSKGGQNWNTMCSSCHSTHVQKNYHSTTDSFKTTYKEINVACESCHGPGRNHINAIKSGNTDPYQKGIALSPEEKTNNCGTCHARRTMLENNGDPDHEFLNRYFPQTLNAAFYEGDGQIKEEDFVYGSFLSSKMHRNHVTCVNCHNPHSGQLKAQGNNLCLQCHENTYSTSKHTHHAENSTGAQCINCHMDGKTYMGNDYRRDHSFRIPRPDQSVKYGTSNACNSCHTDKNAKWAAQNVNKWFGNKRTYHFSDDLLPASLGGEQAMSHLKKLLVDDSIPEIVQATALDYVLQNGTEEAFAIILDKLKDKSALVRIKAYSGLVHFPENYRKQFGLEGLNDPIKSVRIMAFRSVIGINTKQLNPQQMVVWNKTHEEYLTYLKANADFPSGQVMWGEYYQVMKQTNEAIAAFNRALQMDSLQIEPYSNLTILYSGMNDFNAVKSTLKAGISKFPEYPEYYYFMGLNEGDLGNAIGQLFYLKKAYELSPDNSKYAYNYLLLWYQSGEEQNAKAELKEVIKRQPNNPRLVELNKYFTHK